MTKINHNQFVFEGFEVPVQLDTQEKLIALRDDPHAGFLPFSHKEKSQATEMLDYLGNRQAYPAGLGNRLQEIFLRNRRDLGEDEARRAMFSLAYEYGDYALNAKQQHSRLQSLQNELNEEHFKPGVSVAEDFPAGHLGLPAVIRFIDVLAVREKKTQNTVYDPLKVSEVRSIARNNEDDKQHKKVGDRYTATDIPAEVQQRLDAFMEQTTIAQLRPVVGQALANEAQRLEFWTNRLRDTRSHGAAWIIGKQILPQVETVAA